MTSLASRLAPSLLALALALACTNDEPTATGTTDAKSGEGSPAAAPTEPATVDPNAAPAEPPAGPDPVLARLLAWLPSDTLAVSFDRMPTRWSPATLASVFALPPKAAMLLDERKLLDDALAQAFEQPEGEPDLGWLGPQTLAFTLPIIRHAYLVRPVLRSASELDPTFTAAGFIREEIDGKVVWLPKGAFPWRIAVLDEQTIAFVPSDPGAGVQALIDALTTEPTAVEKQLVETLGTDPAIELTLLAGGPMLHFDTDATIAQLQFGLRNAAPQAAYEGLVVMVPDGDVDECGNSLRGRTAPEENQQVQGLIKAVQWTPEPGLTPPQLVGRLTIARDQVKHFAERP